MFFSENPGARFLPALLFCPMGTADTNFLMGNNVIHSHAYIPDLILIVLIVDIGNDQSLDDTANSGMHLKALKVHSKDSNKECKMYEPSNFKG